MKWKTIVVSVCVFCCMATNSFSAEGTGPDKIKAMLILPNVWIGEWRGFGYEGTAETTFEEREDKIIVMIHNELNPAHSCERPVTITSDGFKMDGCNDTDISLFFDPNDQEYPFKGESERFYYKFKLK